MDKVKQPKKNAKAVGILAFISAIYVLVGVIDDRTESSLWYPNTSVLLSSDRWPRQLSLASSLSQSHELTHDSDKFCTVQVHDGTITTASVVNEAGLYHLALPNDYDTTSASIECTHYTRKSLLGEAFTNEEESYTNETILDKVNVTYVNFPSDECDPKNFQPGYYKSAGYYKSKTRTWYDRCMGRSISTNWWTPVLNPLAPDKCPYVASKQMLNKNDPIWVLFIGDSVGRQMFTNGFRTNGIDTQSSQRHWVKNRNYHTYYLISQDQVWFSFMFYFVDGHKGVREIPYTWADFLKMRKEGQREDDPNFPMDKIPDIVLFGPGYHASNMASTAYGAKTEETLLQWRSTWQGIIGTSDAPKLPQVHLILNTMPATWLIPNAYAGDRYHRTLLNEYRKNLALITAARTFEDSYVKSIIDVFSVELPLNGRVGRPTGLRPTAHKDAVHLRGGYDLFWRPAGQRVIHALCNSDS